MNSVRKIKKNTGILTRKEETKILRRRFSRSTKFVNGKYVYLNKTWDYNKRRYISSIWEEVPEFIIETFIKKEK